MSKRARGFPRSHSLPCARSGKYNSARERLRDKRHRSGDRTTVSRRMTGWEPGITRRRDRRAAPALHHAPSFPCENPEQQGRYWARQAAHTWLTTTGGGQGRYRGARDEQHTSLQGTGTVKRGGGRRAAQMSYSRGWCMADGDGPHTPRRYAHDPESIPRRLDRSDTRRPSRPLHVGGASARA